MNDITAVAVQKNTLLTEIFTEIPCLEIPRALSETMEEELSINPRQRLLII